MDPWVYFLGAAVAAGAGWWAWSSTVPVTPPELAAALAEAKTGVDSFAHARPWLPRSVTEVAIDLVDVLDEYMEMATNLATDTTNRPHGVKLMSDIYEDFFIPASNAVDLALDACPSAIQERGFEWLDKVDPAVLAVTRTAAFAMRVPPPWDGTPLWLVAAAFGGGFLAGGLYRWLYPPVPPEVVIVPVDPGPWLDATTSIPSGWWWVVGVAGAAILGWAAWWDRRHPPPR